jgi:hypothetical protein
LFEVTILSKKQIIDYEKLKNKIVTLFLKEYEKLFPIEKNLEETRIWIKNIDEWNQLFDTANSDVQSTMDLITEIEKNISKKQYTLMNVFLYLLIAEGEICNAINFISYLLVLDDHDLFSFTKRKYVEKKITEITKVETSTKLQFLKIHGFEELVKKYDSTLRNKIAHHNYFIDSEGKLWIEGKKINLETKLKNLGVIVEFINDVFAVITKKSREDKRLR